MVIGLPSASVAAVPAAADVVYAIDVPVAVLCQVPVFAIAEEATRAKRNKRKLRVMYFDPLLYYGGVPPFSNRRL
jgi:hypothetical protein